eukprot:c18122_g1_i2.p1 GENE.c18122_g1_i2~~c18122_g1_i2.p1  ORF type:complete len:744 (+),score=188.20 c18122_g1_i2:364-2595(+)
MEEWLGFSVTVMELRILPRKHDFAGRELCVVVQQSDKLFSTARIPHQYRRSIFDETFPFYVDPACLGNVSLRVGVWQYVPQKVNSWLPTSARGRSKSMVSEGGELVGEATVSVTGSILDTWVSVTPAIAVRISVTMSDLYDAASATEWLKKRSHGHELYDEYGMILSHVVTESDLAANARLQSLLQACKTVEWHSRLVPGDLLRPLPPEEVKAEEERVGQLNRAFSLARQEDVEVSTLDHAALKEFSWGGFSTTDRDKIYLRIIDDPPLRSSGRSLAVDGDVTYEDFVRETNGMTDVNIDQITKDIHRTFSHESRTRINDEEGMAKLKRVLCAYAVANPKIGYCQAMNFLAAQLLLILDEVEAFRVLSYICEVALTGYYEKSMSGIVIDMNVIEKLFVREMPELHAHLDRLETSLGVFVTQWMLTACVPVFPTATVFRLIDAVLCNGRIALFAVFMAFFRIHAKELLKQETTETLLQRLRAAHSELFDSEFLFEVAKEECERWGSSVPDLRSQARLEVHKNLEAKVRKVALRQLVEINQVGGDKAENVYQSFLREVVGEPSDEVQELRRSSLMEYRGMDLPQFVPFMQKLNPGFTEDLCKRLFSAFDMNQDGVIDLQEMIICSVVVTAEGTTDDRIEMCFRGFDSNKNGLIDRSELVQFFCFMCSLVFGNADRRYAQMLSLSALQALGLDQCSSLTLEQFKQVVYAQPVLRGSLDLAQTVNQQVDDAKEEDSLSDLGEDDDHS